MEDDPRAVDGPHPGAPGGVATAVEPAEGPADGPAVAPGSATTRRRRWPRRVGVALVVLLVGALVGLQLQAARVRDQAATAETAQRVAELDEESAQIRLDSVGDRVLVARKDEAAASDRLAQARRDMTDKGFEEPALHGIQVAKAKQVKDLRGQVKAVAAIIAEQKQLRPAADACLFDMLRALGDGSRGGTEACRRVAGHSGAG